MTGVLASSAADALPLYYPRAAWRKAASRWFRRRDVVLSVIPSKLDHKIARVDSRTWAGFVSMFAAPLEANIPKDRLPLWSAASYRDGYLEDANVEHVYALAFDVDEDPIPSRADLEQLVGLRAVVSTSSSSTAEAPHWRLVFALSRPVTVDEYRHVWAVVADSLHFPVGAASKNPSRGWYAPRRGVDGYYETFEVDGDSLDVDELLAMTPAVATSSPSTSSESPSTTTSTPAIRSSAARLLADAWPPRGQRCSARLALSGALRSSGLAQEEAAGLMREMHGYLADRGDVTDASLDAMAASTYARGDELPTAGWPTLARCMPAPILTAVSGLLSRDADLRAAVELECLTPQAAAPVSGVQAVAMPDADDIGETWGGWDEPILPPVYLLDGLIPEGKVVTFFAEGGSVKSWSAFALAISVATGRPWLGRAVQQGRALILDYEDGRYEFQRRMRILRGGELDDIPELGYTYMPPELSDKAMWPKLARKGLRLLVIDTLGSGMPGDADENTTAFAAGMKIAGRFTECGCTVLIVAHANKTGGLRGSSAIRDSSDVVFKFEAVSETDSVKRMRMVCDKPGPQKRPKPVNVELSDAGLTTFEDEASDVGRNATAPEGIRAAILLALESGPRLVSDLRIGRDKQRVADELRALTEAGKIVSLGKREGVQLDDAEKRRARLLAAAETCDTRVELRDTAHVLGEDVDAALKEGAITLRTGRDGGGFIVAGGPRGVGAST